MRSLACTLWNVRIVAGYGEKREKVIEKVKSDPCHVQNAHVDWNQNGLIMDWMRGTQRGNIDLLLSLCDL